MERWRRGKNRGVWIKVAREEEGEGCGGGKRGRRDKEGVEIWEEEYTDGLGSLNNAYLSAAQGQMD